MVIRLAGVLPIIFFASVPIATTRFVFLCMAITEGSRAAIPFPFTNTIVLAVPRSIPRSCENKLKNLSNIFVLQYYNGKRKNAIRIWYNNTHGETHYFRMILVLILV